LLKDRIPEALLLPRDFFVPGRERTKNGMRRSSGEVVTRLCTVALLAALGFVLMAFARIPYPPAPWLMIEFSEVTVLIAYALYGWGGALFVAVAKTGLDLAVNGPTDPLFVGHLTALLTSLLFVLSLFLTAHVFHWFRKGLGYRILAYVCLALFVSLTMTALNGLFITPTYAEGSYTTCFSPSSIANVMKALGKEGVSGAGVYWGTIFGLYLPFNLIKTSSVCLLYEVLFNALIFVLMERSPKMKKYFVGSVFEKESGSKEETEKTKR